MVGQPQYRNVSNRGLLSRNSDAGKHSKTSFWIFLSLSRVILMMFTKTLCPSRILWFFYHANRTSIDWCQQVKLSVRLQDTHLCKAHILVFHCSYHYWHILFNFYNRHQSNAAAFESRCRHWNHCCFVSIRHQTAELSGCTSSTPLLDHLCSRKNKLSYLYLDLFHIHSFLWNMLLHSAYWSSQHSYISLLFKEAASLRARTLDASINN